MGNVTYYFITSCSADATRNLGISKPNTQTRRVIVVVVACHRGNRVNITSNIHHSTHKPRRSADGCGDSQPMQGLC